MYQITTDGTSNHQKTQFKQSNARSNGEIGNESEKIPILKIKKKYLKCAFFAKP